MISVTAVSKSRAHARVLEEVSLAGAEGTVTAIVGPSGSGKSTLLRCLNGLETFESGGIDIAGHRLEPGPHAPNRLELLRRDVGMVFQQFNLFAHMSVLDNVGFGLKMRGLPKQETRRRAQQALELVQLVGHEGKSARSRAEILADLNRRLKTIPGVFAVVGGPLADRIGHMLSGVSAPVAVKIFGPDLDTLRRLGTEIQTVAKTIPGFEDAKLDQQSSIPQLRIEADRTRASAYGITPGALNDQLGALIGGKSIAELREGQRAVDLVIRLPLAAAIISRACRFGGCREEADVVVVVAVPHLLRLCHNRLNLFRRHHL